MDETQRAPEPESGPPTRLQHYGYAPVLASAPQPSPEDSDPGPQSMPQAFAPSGLGFPPVLGALFGSLQKQEPDLLVVLGICEIGGHDVHVVNFGGGAGVELLHVRSYASLSPALEQARSVLLAQNRRGALAYVYKTKVVIVGTSSGFEQPLFSPLAPESLRGRQGVDDDQEAEAYAYSLRRNGALLNRFPAGGNGTGKP